MRSNSGLASRFPHTFEFACYSYAEMSEIFVGMAEVRVFFCFFYFSFFEFACYSCAEMSEIFLGMAEVRFFFFF